MRFFTPRVHRRYSIVLGLALTAGVLSACSEQAVPLNAVMGVHAGMEEADARDIWKPSVEDADETYMRLFNDNGEPTHAAEFSEGKVVRVCREFRNGSPFRMTIAGGPTFGNVDNLDSVQMALGKPDVVKPSEAREGFAWLYYEDARAEIFGNESQLFSFCFVDETTAKAW